MRALAAVVVVLSGLAAGSMQAAGGEAVEDEAYVEEVVVQRVRWPAIVDRQRKAPDDACRHLEPGDFLVTEDGRRARVTSVDRERGSTLFIFLVDVSSSMTQRLDGVKDAAIEFARELAPLDEVTVFTFSRGVDLIAPATRDPDALEAGLDDIKIGFGNTALADAAWEVLDQFVGRKGREVLVLFTDGGENASEHHTLEDLIRRAGRSPDLRVFPVMTVPYEDFKVSAPLRWLAEASAGRCEIVARDQELDDALHAIQERLLKEVLLSYEPPERADDSGESRRIRVRIRPRPGLPCRIVEGSSARTLPRRLE